MKKILSRLFSISSTIDLPDIKNRFYVLYQKTLQTRLYITVITTFAITGMLFFVGYSMNRGAKTSPELREIFMFMLGSLVSVWTIQQNYWFNSRSDEKLLQLAHEETGRKLPKETNSVTVSSTSVK